MAAPNNANSNSVAVSIANVNFQCSLEEPLGRHVRALERSLMESTDIRMIRTEPYRDVVAGKARLQIPPTDHSCVPFRYAMIIYGTSESPPKAGERGPTIADSEWYHKLKPRLALAHELGHLALGHCDPADERGEFGVPATGFSKQQDWAACLYAAHLIWVCGKYLRERHKLLLPAVQTIEDTAAYCWPSLCGGKRFSEAFKVCRRHLPDWTDVSSQEAIMNARAALGEVGRSTTIRNAPSVRGRKVP